LGLPILSREPVAYSFALASSRILLAYMQIFAIVVSNIGLLHFYEKLEFRSATCKIRSRYVIH